MAQSDRRAAAAGEFIGKDIDKYKKVGTGIGAIAGYWAGGRQKQS